MCGIAGFGTMTDVTRAMVPHLLWEIDNRGRDSWAASNGSETVKELGSILDTFPLHSDEVLAWDRAIFHTRGASTGDVTLENQHPFVFAKGEGENWERTVVGIHNGIVANHKELCEKYDRKFEVDSMHIYAHLAAGLPTSEIHGWGNLAWYEYSPKYPTGVLYLLRFNNDMLHIGFLESGEAVFCSTLDPIIRAARFAGSKVRMMVKTEGDHLYRIESLRNEAGVWTRDAIMDTKTKLPFGYRHYYPPNQNSFEDWRGTGCAVRNGNRYSDPYSQSHHRDKHASANIHTVQREARASNLCGALNCDEPVDTTRKQRLLCEKHFSQAFLSTVKTIERLNHV